MKNLMRAAVSLGALTLVASGTVRGQENIMPFMRSLPQRQELNPAMTDTRLATWFQLPGVAGVAINAENTGFDWSDMFMRGADDSLHLDFGRLHDRMREINLTSVSIDIPLMAYGRRLGKSHYFSAMMYDKTRSEVIFHRSLTNLRRGNWDFDNFRPIDQEVSDVFIRTMNYLEVAFGYSNDALFGGKLKIGGRVKFLAGVAAAQSDDLHIRFNTVRESDRYRVEMHSGGSVKTSVPFTVRLDSAGYVDKLDFSDTRIGDFSPFRNRGLAFDVGATFTPNDTWSFGLSFVDVGFIKWHSGCHKFMAASGVVMRGVDMDSDIKNGINGHEDQVSDYWEALKDSLLRFTDVTNERIEYKTRMTSRMIATAEFNVPGLQWLSVGGSVATKFVNNRAFTRGGVAASIHWKKWFSLMGSLAINPGVHVTPGIGLSLQSRAFQFYAIADRFPHNLESSSGAALAFGFNFFVGTKRRQRAESAKQAFLERMAGEYESVSGEM